MNMIKSIYKNFTFVTNLLLIFVRRENQAGKQGSINEGKATEKTVNLNDRAISEVEKAIKLQKDFTKTECLNETGFPA